MGEPKSLRVAYGEALVKVGEHNDKVVVLDADLSHATMTCLFAEKYPERFFNMGIAEQNLICAAAGMAYSGLTPFISTFALFGAGRAYEQIRNSISYTNADVKLGLSHSGLSVGEDGGSHQAVEDIALMRVLPGMTILVPCDPIKMEKAVFASLDIKGPVYIRVARPVCSCITKDNDPFIPGKPNVMREGTDIAIFATGLMVSEALEAADILKANGISAAVLNFHTIKPFDSEAALNWAKKTGAIITVEEHSIIGGLGSAAAEAIAEISNLRFDRIGIQDRFGQSGKPADLFQRYGLTAKDIAQRCTMLLSKGYSQSWL
jgi:transketolase